MNKAREFKGEFALLGAAFFFSLYGVWVRYISSEFSVLFQIWTRTAIPLIIFLIIGLLKKQFKKIEKEDYKWFFVVALSASLMNLPYVWAVLNLPLGTAMFILYASSTIVGYILGAVLFKERLNSVKILSLILSILGLILLYAGNLQLVRNWNLLFALLSGILYGMYFTTTKKISDKYSVVQVDTFYFLINTLVYLSIFLVLHDHFYLNFLSTGWLFNLIYIFTIMATSVLVVFGFRYVEAQKGSLIVLAELPFVLLLGFFLFKEVPGVLNVFGATLILVALILPNLNLYRNHSREA